MISTKLPKLSVLSALLLLCWNGPAAVFAQTDVTQPGDALIASSANSPGSEGVANAIDNKPTKYLNFDSDADAAAGFKPSGFVVTPSVGLTRVVGISLQSANDAQDRDAKSITLEGSNDDEITAFDSGNWEMIATIENIPSWPSIFGDADHRFRTQTLLFDNFKAYKHYRWIVTATQGPSTCCMQIAEVELLGSTLPSDVTQPGDAIIASSANSPGSEGAANALDNKPTKYLNFDSDADAAAGFKPSGFVVSPSLGTTVITGMTLQSANDAADRDAKSVKLEGSNDDQVSAFDSGNWELIQQFDDIPSWPSVFGDADNRFKTQIFLFDNYKPYKHYRWTVLATQGPSTCCMQIAEVELLGTGAPQDVTQPGDAIIASSANSPGSEGAANALDNKPTKYLNFDSDADAAGGYKPSGFVVTPSVGATTVTGMSLQSANDAADRDPKTVKLEGSNDDQITAFDSGAWELIVQLEFPSWPSVFGDADHRFKIQELYFPNQRSYKHYRWTVLATQGPSTCCMQIAEVELLAATSGADCTKARFLVQPVNTPVLEGQPATFVALVNGPWPVQWYRNDELIPGANQATYTTGAVTAQNVADVYSVQIVGCEMSTPVTASIFRPSTTKSIGINFRGGGANGAPTTMNPTDIAGLHPQAYWINAMNTGTGYLPDFGDPWAEPPVPPVDMVDSDNQATPITFEWNASGTWGTGTGNLTPTQRSLNGMVVTPNGADGASTLAFQGVPDGQHAVIVYTVGIPLQFQNAAYTIMGQSEQTIHTRVMNADEYNAAPGFYRGASTDPNVRTIASYVRFDNVRPSGGQIALEWKNLTAGFDRGTPVNAVQLILNAAAPGAPPLITAQPQPVTVAADGTARVSVSATGENLTYQWLKNGRNLPNGGNVSGATSANLVISDFIEADQAVYSVAVFNPGGSTISKNASVRISKFNIQDALAGYWKFDETSGGTAVNAASSANPGKVDGTASWVTGQVGRAIGLDGTTYLVVDNYTKAVAGISAAAWVKVDPSAAGVQAPMTFIRNGDGNLRRSGDGSPALAGQFDFGVIWDDAANGFKLSAAVMSGPNIPRATAPAVFPLGTWHHVAFSADGAQVHLYINGVEVATADYLGNINPPDVNYLTIGVQFLKDEDGTPVPDPTNPKNLIGQLDDLALWSRALSADEVSKISAAGKLGQALTTVEITPPIASVPTLRAAFASGNLTLTWESGRLQSASAVNGPWTDVVGASPLTEATAGAAKFYRAVSP